MNIKEIAGVLEVSVRRDGAALNFNVVVEELDFDVYDQIVQHELDVTARHPELVVHFDIMPIAAIREERAPHAA